MMRFVPCRWTTWRGTRSALLALVLMLGAIPFAQAANENGPSAIQKPKVGDERDAGLSGHAILPAPPAEAVIEPSPDAPDAVCATTVLPTDGSTSGNARAPSVRYRGIKTVYLITAAELAAAGMPNGSSPSGIGWHYSTGPGNVGSGTLIVYLQNTTDTTFTKSTSFATAITGMTTVHNAATSLPNTTTPFDITFSGGSPFTYTGGGLYVAFQWTYAGTLSTAAVTACNTVLTNGAETAQSTTGAAADGTTVTSFRPETRLSVTINNDVSVDYVLSYGEVPSGLTGAQTIRAIVTNHGSARTNIPVQLNITGAESFTDTQNIAALAQCGGQTTVSFASWTPSVLGSDSIAVSVPADDTNVNNTVTKPFAFTANRYSYKHPGTTAVAGGVGFTGGTGEFVSKFTVSSATQVDSALLEFMTAGGAYRVVVYADSGTGTPGAQLYSDAADRTAPLGLVTARLAAPVAVGPGNFFLGVQQRTTTNMGYSFDAETPIRSGSFFYSTTFNTGPWTDESPGNNFKLNMGAIVGSCIVPLTNDVTPNSASVCAGNPLVFTSTAIGGTGTTTYQWTENGSDISGQTATTLSVTKASAGVFNYNARVTDDGGCIILDPSDSVGTWAGTGDACDDGNACTAGDTCSGSVCSGTNPCDDGNACTVDLCNPVCSHPPVNCDDNNPCTDDSCNPGTGCVHTPNTASCTDNNPCTIGDVCSGGACVPGSGSFGPPVHVCNNTAITIPAVGSATPYPSAINVSGAQSVLCKVTVELNGVTHIFPDDIDVLLARASGTNAIIMSDVGGGTSVTGVNLVLDDAAASAIPDAGPLVSGTFKPTNVNPGTGTEAWPAPAPAPLGGSALSVFNGANPNGAWNLFVVDDESPDAGSMSGWCVNLSTVCGGDAECNDNNVCTDDACVNSVCVHAPNAAACDDGNPCTSGDHCGGGVCLPGVNPCDDGDACTVDVCGAGGSCTYNPVNCDDANACTDDSCNPVTGCVHVNNTAPCSDGNVCTVGDVCSGGSCVPGAPPAAVQFCNNNAIQVPASPTTTGIANPYPSSISVTAGPIVCSVTVDINGVVHTFPDDIDVLLAGPAGQNAIVMSDVGGSNVLSAPGVNLHLADAAAASLPDSGALTTGTFKPTNIGTGDTFAAPAPAPSGGSVLSVFNGTNPNGNWDLWVVDDASGDAGSFSSWCINIASLCSSNADCNDNNPCTDDSCNPATGQCIHTNNSSPCDDNNACTANDTCSGGVCVGGPPPSCDDGDACTTDSCNPATGLCQHSGIICNDNNPCTDDACVSPGGCVFTPNNANLCSDNDTCTQTDTCVNGTCVGSDPLDCNDGNVCTTDVCDPNLGCVYTNNTNACDDGNACTAGDVCAPRLAENFDGVTAPALPSGWTSSQTGTGSLWVTSSASSDTAPNSALGADGATVSDEVLVSPTFPISSGAAVLTFRTRWSFESATSCFDAGVLEISIGGGAFTDIVTAGGSFASGGYTGTVSTGFSNPLGGRNAWCNASTGYPNYLNVMVNLPPAAAGQNVQLRWRIGTDTSTGAAGQNVDSIVVVDPTNTCTPGTPVNCDDGNVCTADSCNPATGCVNTPISCDDNDPCTADTCNPASGCISTPITAPPEVQGVAVAADKTTFSWGAALYASQYDVVRGTLGGLPVGPGGGDETCFDDVLGTSVNDASVPGIGGSFWYLTRGENTCGQGTWGNATSGPRSTTTCP